MLQRRWITTSGGSGVGLCDRIGALCLKVIVTVWIGGRVWGG